MTKDEIAAKVAEIGDACVFKGPHPKGGDWVVILKAPAPQDWDFYLVGRETAGGRAVASLNLVRSMVAFVSPQAAKYEPGEIPGPQADFDRLRSRVVGMPQAIWAHRRFDRFIGLEIDAEEKG
jgi:hypothetical protein